VRIESAFEVPVSPERAWDLLMDVPRVIPCMPGATLTDTIDDQTWKAMVNVKLGPISLAFDTDVKRDDADASARRARLSATARESRGRGAASATIDSWLTALDDGTRVDVATELQLNGAVAQYGRGIVQDVSEQIVQSFAECLKAQLVAAPGEAGATAARQSEPVRGVRLGLGAVWSRITSIFGTGRRAT
jgi:carbon monoxide dehydrogenase subunit G